MEEPLLLHNLELLTRGAFYTKALLEFCPVPILIVDNNGTILGFTKFFQEFFKISEDSGNIFEILKELTKKEQNFKYSIENSLSCNHTVEYEDRIIGYSIHTIPLHKGGKGSIVLFEDKTLRWQLLKKIEDVPNRVVCEDQSHCIWRSMYGKELRDVAEYVLKNADKF